MNIILPGDKDYESRPSVQRKSLRINLNENIYGTFVEIGAGQEVARNFYRVGAASGTIAKSMSAYDKSFSDSIYGKEENGRYVTQNRLDKMLDHEMDLLEKRISRDKNPDKFFFVLKVLIHNLCLQEELCSSNFFSKLQRLFNK